MSTATTPVAETPTASTRCQQLVTRLAQITGDAWTFGYIGNLDRQHDDRAWYAFAPHPNRVGTSQDRLGGVGTDQLDSLAEMLRGAVALAHMQAHRS